MVQLKIDKQYGALIEMTVSVGSATRTIKGMIDCGCNRTSLDSSVIAALQIAPVGCQPVTTAMGVMVRNLYRAKVKVADVELADLLVSEDMYPRSFPGMPPDFDALIGRDVLDRGVFVYDGPGGVFSFGAKATP